MKHHSGGNILDNVCMKISIVLSLFMILGITNGIEANETSHSREKGFFGYTWQNSSNLLRSLFGAPATRIYDGKDITDIDSFELFLQELAKATKVNIEKKVVTVDELSRLHKPAIIIRRDRRNFGIFLNSYETKNGEMYQILSSSAKPFLFNRQQMIEWWSGEVWHVPEKRKMDIVYNISADSRMRISEVYHNLGLIQREPETKHFESMIHLKNIGNQPVEISAIRTSCSCTTGRIGGGGIVKPGEDREILVSLDIPTGKEGVRYVVVVSFQDIKSQKRSYLKYEIIGNFIDDGLDLSPHQLRFLDIRDGGDNERTIRISERGTARINKIDLESSKGFIVAKLKRKTVINGLRTYYFTVSIAPHTLPNGGQVKDVISISTDHPEYTGYSIPVEITKSPEVMCIPSRVAFGFCELNQIVADNVIIRRANNKCLAIRKCDTADDVNVAIEKKNNTLKLKITSQISKIGMWKRDVKIYFDDPKDGMLTIPLFAIVRKRDSSIGAK